MAILDQEVDYYLCSCHRWNPVFFIGRRCFSWPPKIIRWIKRKRKKFIKRTVRKCSEHFRMTYGNTGQLFRPYYCVRYGLWLSCTVLAPQSVVGGSIYSGGDHGIHSWWDLIKSKQLSSVSVCHAKVFAAFSDHGNSIHNIIPHLKKEKCRCISLLYRS